MMKGFFFSEACERNWMKYKCEKMTEWLFLLFLHLQIIPEFFFWHDVYSDFKMSPFRWLTKSKIFFLKLLTASTHS